MRFKNQYEYEARMDYFVDGLLRIQRRHYYWFESRYGESEAEEHDMIGNHVVITCRYPTLIFGYWSDSELPENIRAECNAFFDEVFNHEQQWN